MQMFAFGSGPVMASLGISSASRMYLAEYGALPLVSRPREASAKSGSSIWLLDRSTTNCSSELPRGV